MNFKEFFSPDFEITAKYLGKETIHHLHEPDEKVFTSFRRVSSQVHIVGNGELKSTDAALLAPVMLYDKICTRVQIQDGETLVDMPENFRELIPRDLKLAVITAWQNRFEVVLIPKKSAAVRVAPEENNVQNHNEPETIS